jgi:UDP-glucose 4-epimerase
MSVLVIGGAGYIGSHTVRELVRSGRQTVVFDNLSKGHRDAVPDATPVSGDLHDTESLKQTIKKNSVDAVIHFAAFIEVGESMTDPQKYYRNNVIGTLNLLKVMRETGVGRIIFSSSAAVYGEPETIPITEEAALKPTSVYGRTKMIIELALADYAMAYGLLYAALRYFNVAGADPSGDIGEDHDPETHLIPLIIKTLLGERARFSLFGTDYPTRDGTCIRDYIHVTDLARAHILALDWLEQGGQSRVYNLGNGNGFSNREIIQAVERVTGRKLNFAEEARRPGDPAVLVASSRKIMEELGWKPEFDSLDTIIETAWRWHTSHPTGYNR